MVDDEVSGDGAKPSRRRPAPATRTSERRESRVEPSLARRHRREHRDRAIAKRGRKERASNERRPRARRSDRAACTRPATRGQALAEWLCQVPRGSTLLEVSPLSFGLHDDRAERLHGSPAPACPSRRSWPRHHESAWRRSSLSSALRHTRRTHSLYSIQRVSQRFEPRWYRNMEVTTSRNVMLRKSSTPEQGVTLLRHELRGVVPREEGRPFVSRCV